MRRSTIDDGAANSSVTRNGFNTFKFITKSQRRFRNTHRVACVLIAALRRATTLHRAQPLEKIETSRELGGERQKLWLATPPHHSGSL